MFDKYRTQVVLGMQWGDEGKGKVVDLLAEQCDMVIRYQGGANAGHTVQFDGKQFILHLVPSGILRPGLTCVIGNGVVLDPESFLEEIHSLESEGFEVMPRLHISHLAHLILPFHKFIDKAKEASKAGQKIGTTGRGIGPAYSDKISREGLRICDIMAPDWQDRIRTFMAVKNRQLGLYDHEPLPDKEAIDLIGRFRGKAAGSVTDTRRFVYQSRQEGRRMLLEGAQGTLLDIDFGTYPYVTSSNTTIGGVFTGLGLNPRNVDRVIGILKAYTTRVGNGPFPTELTDDTGEHLREKGHEFGATTGRPRRCGWFDATIGRYAVQVNGVDAIVLTKLDVLDNMETIKICTGYRIGDSVFTEFINDCSMLAQAEPVYETMPGWQTDTSDIKTYRDLPGPARAYIERLETLCETPIETVSLGPARSATLWRAVA
ncbi:adenylosuccinate synthase [bacterium]|nr:adenylosuccinate synthase [bacterium]